MKIAIIKYNAGNVRSVMFALERLGVRSTLTDDPEEIRSSDKVIFPGVGEASSAMNHLKKHNLDALVKSLRQPVLGICLGMQLMCRYSEEGNTGGIGIFDEDVKRFRNGLKVPQIGWNNLSGLKDELFSGIDKGAFVYFVHGYYAGLNPCTIAEANYGVNFSSAMRKDNFYAVQFHPEKSGKTGQTILQNFLNL